jgi:hypothetical protein
LNALVRVAICNSIPALLTQVPALFETQVIPILSDLVMDS